MMKQHYPFSKIALLLITSGCMLLIASCINEQESERDLNIDFVDTKLVLEVDTSSLLPRDSVTYFIESLNMAPVAADYEATDYEVIYHKSVNKSKVIEALERNVDVLPAKAILGGKMFFTKIKMLNEKLILANYEDGHTGGYALIEYKVNESGQITFSTIQYKNY